MIEKKVYEREDVYKETLNYFNNDELATNVWIDKYCLKDKDKNLLERTPDDMHKRLAKEFARIEQNYPNSLSEVQIYNLFKKFEYIIPQGRVMAGLGANESYRSLSNCLVLPSPEDSYNSIMYVDTMLVNAAKRGCGYGIDLSNIRPEGSPTTNAAKTSTGVVPFMERYSNSTREVGQDSRRGACLLGIDIKHPDSSKFITAKKDRTKVTGANISLKVDDAFMKAVEDNTTYDLEFNNKVYKTVNAKDLWNLIISTTKNDAEPGFFYFNRMQNYDPVSVYKDHQIVLTNACQPKYATILTPNGISTIENVNIGDLIWSGKNWVEIINKWSTGIKKVYKYTTTTGYFIGTEDHRILENKVKIEVGLASKIDYSLGDSSLLTKDFDIQDIMDGIVLGDGSIHKASNNLVHLYIGKGDYDYFDSEIKDLIIKHRPGLKDTAYEICTSITHEELPKTYERIIPNRFFFGDEMKKRGFLRGLFTANGSISGNRVTLKQSSKILIEQVQEMLSSLGIHSYITVNKEKDVEFLNGTYKCKQSYDLNISAGKDLFKEYIGFIQKYKQEGIIKANKPKYLSSDIKEIIELGEEEVFELTVDCEEHTYWTGGILASNCGEQPMGAFDSCRLIVLNLYSFVDNPFTKEPSLNVEALYNYSKTLLRLADDLVDLEIEYIDRILNKIESDPEDDFFKIIELELWNNVKSKAIRGRRCGCGITGLADMLAALNLKYDSDEALKVIELVAKTKFKAELESSIELATERGAFPDYDYNLEYKNNIPQNEFYKMIQDEFPELIKPRRNINFNTIAPTGTTSLMTQTSSGCEPVFKTNYKRRRKVEKNSKNISFVDAKGDCWEEHLIFHHKFKQWLNKNSIIGFLNIGDFDYHKNNYASLKDGWALKIDDLEYVNPSLEFCCENSPYYKSTANEIDWRKRIQIQSILQKYTTSAISSTVNLPNTITLEEMSEMYMLGWKLGLKGLTSYIEGSRDGVLISNDKKEDHFHQHNAPKRPKELYCEAKTVVARGNQWLVIIGLYENKPYEVFALPTFKEDLNVKGKYTGKIIKKAKGIYDLELIDGENNTSSITNFTDLMSDEENNLTRMISTALRHGSDIKFVVEQLNKSKGDITSFAKSIARSLKVYLKDGDLSKSDCPNCGNVLIYQDGCEKCTCGFSKCS